MQVIVNTAETSEVTLAFRQNGTDGKRLNG